MTCKEYLVGFNFVIHFFSDISKAVTNAPSFSNWAVLPPGAAHKSNTFSFLILPINSTGICAARFCTHHAPSL